MNGFFNRFAKIVYILLSLCLLIVTGVYLVKICYAQIDLLTGLICVASAVIALGVTIAVMTEPKKKEKHNVQV